MDADFPRLVREIRVTHGLTQQQLARELDVSFATVDGWENGKHQPMPLLARTLLRMAQEHGINTSSKAVDEERAPHPWDRKRRTDG